jgi:uncharacterized membrane protein
MFWGTEGAGASWPGDDAALLVIVPATALLGIALSAALRSTRRAHHAAATAKRRTAAL